MALVARTDRRWEPFFLAPRDAAWIGFPLTGVITPSPVRASSDRMLDKYESNDLHQIEIGPAIQARGTEPGAGPGKISAPCTPLALSQSAGLAGRGSFDSAERPRGTDQPGGGHD